MRQAGLYTAETRNSRVTPDNRIYFIEANPNPILAADEDFANSALKSGLAYPQLIERIIRTGLKTVRE